MTTGPDMRWIDRFVEALQRLASSGPSEHFRRLAHELYPDLNSLPPEDVAAYEWRALEEQPAH